MESSRGPVIAFGELLWDLLPSGKALGGAPANFAYRLHQLGIDVRLVSRLGDDAPGQEARRMMATLAVPLSLVQTDTIHPTGTVPVTLSDEGSATYVILPDVAYDYIEWTAELAQTAAEASLICFGTLVQRAAVTRATLYQALDAAPQATKLLDINLRRDCYSAETVHNALSRSDIVKLNDEEVVQVGALLGLPAGGMAGFTEALFNRYPADIVLVTRGKEGVVGFQRNGEMVDVPGRSVTVVDTIGAGDAFTAGFVARYLNGASLAECCAFGNRVGAAVAGVKGGMSPVAITDERSTGERSS